MPKKQAGENTKKAAGNAKVCTYRFRYMDVPTS